MTYIDNRCWRYRVMPGIDTPPSYKVRYNKPGKSGWYSTEGMDIWRK